jgi:hypothetical protein
MPCLFCECKISSPESIAFLRNLPLSFFIPYQKQAPHGTLSTWSSPPPSFPPALLASVPTPDFTTFSVHWIHIQALLQDNDPCWIHCAPYKPTLLYIAVHATEPVLQWVMHLQTYPEADDMDEFIQSTLRAITQTAPEKALFVVEKSISAKQYHDMDPNTILVSPSQMGGGGSSGPVTRWRTFLQQPLLPWTDSVPEQPTDAPADPRIVAMFADCIHPFLDSSAAYSSLDDLYQNILSQPPLTWTLDQFVAIQYHFPELHAPSSDLVQDWTESSIRKTFASQQCIHHFASASALIDFVQRYQRFLQLPSSRRAYFMHDPFRTEHSIEFHLFYTGNLPYSSPPVEGLFYANPPHLTSADLVPQHVFVVLHNTRSNSFSALRYKESSLLPLHLFTDSVYACLERAPSTTTFTPPFLDDMRQDIDLSSCPLVSHHDAPFDLLLLDDVAIPCLQWDDFEEDHPIRTECPLLPAASSWQQLQTWSSRFPQWNCEPQGWYYCDDTIVGIVTSAQCMIPVEPTPAPHPKPYHDPVWGIGNCGDRPLYSSHQQWDREMYLWFRLCVQQCIPVWTHFQSMTESELTALLSSRIRFCQVENNNTSSMSCRSFLEILLSIYQGPDFIVAANSRVHNDINNAARFYQRLFAERRR